MNYNPSKKNQGLSTNGEPRPTLFTIFNSEEKTRADPYAYRKRSAIDFQTPILTPQIIKQPEFFDSVGQLQKCQSYTQQNTYNPTQHKVKPAQQDNVMLNAPIYQHAKREQYQNEKSTFDNDNSYKKRRGFNQNELSNLFQPAVTPTLIAGPRRPDPLMRDDHDNDVYFHGQ